MKKQNLLIIASLLLPQILYAKDQIQIVGSSTVFPFATIVAENFQKKSKSKPPIVESLGTGGGFKIFCASGDENSPDIAMASRPIKKSESDDCQKNGAGEIIEHQIGIDGIVLVHQKNNPPFNLSDEELYLALAQFVPDKNNQPVVNPYKKWSDINKALPDKKIVVYGPPTSSGTRDSLIELIITANAKKKFSQLEKDKPEEFKKISTLIRNDNAYIDAGENDSLIVNKLSAQKESYGILGYSFLYLNGQKIQGAKINNIEPNEDTMENGKYILSRPLYIYTKKSHIALNPQIKSYLEEFLSEKTIGDEGYLIDKGLAPVSKATRQKNRDLIK